jgi:uncharacterized membrane protein YoaK (UPF0700 family)
VTEPRSIAAPGVFVLVSASLAGLSDTFGFVALFGLFTAHVSGNFVQIVENHG